MGHHTDQTASRPDLTTTQQRINRALSAARTPVERSIARLKTWRTLSQSPRQPQPHDGHLHCRPHPGASTLKGLTRSCRRLAKASFCASPRPGQPASPPLPHLLRSVDGRGPRSLQKPQAQRRTRQR
ncbi:transposase family protein [Streptomyces sp. NPDC058052]|uniref:transposase family protein n=1 Tax=Streptomyces sp. NPDC058052 TaxID=3346316 RepID=UPI0036E33865